MHKTFCVGIQDLTGQKTFIRFGENATVSDIMDVIDEEVKANKGTQMLGMSFLAAPSKKKLIKLVSDWRGHFDKK